MSSADQPDKMDIANLTDLRRMNPAWRLVCSQSAPFVISFLHDVFIKENRIHGIVHNELVERLRQYQRDIQFMFGDLTNTYDGTPEHYIDDWMADPPYLRKYHNDEGYVEYDLTPNVDAAIRWVKSFTVNDHHFSESRLRYMMSLLTELTVGTSEDPEEKRAELIRRRNEIEAELSRLDAGEVDTLGRSKIIELFTTLCDTGNKLISDFRSIARYFRDFDRDVSERIAAWTKSDGELIADILDDKEVRIESTPEGHSFDAFFSLICEHKESFNDMIEAVARIPEVRDYVALNGEEGLSRITNISENMLSGAITVNKVRTRINEKLSSQVVLRNRSENKRVISLASEVERLAISMYKAVDSKVTFTHVDEHHPSFDLPWMRQLASPKKKKVFDLTSIEVGAPSKDVKPSTGVDIFIDRKALKANINQEISIHGQVSLKQISERHRVNYGVTELLEYMRMARPEAGAKVIEDVNDEITISTKDGQQRLITLPRIIFTRTLK